MKNSHNGNCKVIITPRNVSVSPKHERILFYNSNGVFFSITIVMKCSVQVTIQGLTITQHPLSNFANNWCKKTSKMMEVILVV